MGQKIFQKILGRKKNSGVKKKFGSEKLLVRNFGSGKKILVRKKLGPKSLVQIGLVTAEILLIWTNVIRAYVAITVGIYETWSKDPTFKVWSKPGHRQLRFLIWTNVPRTNIVWTNVTVTDGSVSVCAKFQCPSMFRSN